MRCDGLKGAHGARASAPLAAAACSLALLCATPGGASASAQGGQSGADGGPQDSATLEQCVTSVAQVERSATFAGEMTALAGTVRMAMRIEVQERVAGEALYHTVSAPGLGVWRESDVKVKIYKYLKQVTNLSSPASYRALVRFRWLGARGHVIRRAERVTSRCVQPAPPPPAAPPNAQP
jgi:hypothetical protein